MHGNVDLVCERFTQIRIAFCHFAEFRAVQGRVERTVWSSTPAAQAATRASRPRAESEFERGESFGRRFHLIRPRLTLRPVEHVRRTAMRVNRNVLPDRSAEQPVNWVTSDLSGKIPKCNIDTADRRDIRHE